MLGALLAAVRAARSWPERRAQGAEASDGFGSTGWGVFWQPEMHASLITCRFAACAKAFCAAPRRAR